MNDLIPFRCPADDRAPDHERCDPAPLGRGAPPGGAAGGCNLVLDRMALELIYDCPHQVRARQPRARP